MLRVFIPSTVVSSEPSEDEKVRELSRLARALAVFRADEVVIVNVRDREDETKLVDLILNYIVTPPYLRRVIYPLKPELRFAGLTKPLAIYTHNPTNEPPRRGQLREGIVTRSWGMRAKAYVGLRNECVVQASRELSPGQRILIRIESVNPLKCTDVSRDDVSEYTGYAVSVVNEERVRSALRGCFTVNATKRGASIADERITRKVVSGWRGAGCVNVLFGDPRHDFDEIVGLKPGLSVNFIPEQGTLTVRSVEAIWAALSILNYLYETGSE